MPFGITSTGFAVETVDDLVNDLNGAVLAAFGQNTDVSPQSPWGQVIGIMAERYADLWALGQFVWASYTRDGAFGLSLDNIGALTGTQRRPATSSSVTVTATGTPGTVIPATSLVRVAITTEAFATLASGTIASVPAWAGTHSYSANDRVTNGGNVYLCTTSGTSAGSGGPTTTAADITDGAAHWRYLGQGTGAVDIPTIAQDTGPVQAVSGTLTQIGTPLSGWSSAINILDASLGTDIETDPDYRTRQEVELRIAGRAALEPIRANLLEVAGVTAVTVFENVTDTTDGNGLPPHSIMALVSGGTDTDIAQSIFANVAAGIATYGSSNHAVVDSQGISHTIYFSRPSLQTIWVTLNVSVDSTLYPSDGDQQVKNALLAFGLTYKNGLDVRAAALASQTFKVLGVLDCTALISLTNPPTVSTTIPISLLQLATFDSSRTVVNSTPVTP